MSKNVGGVGFGEVRRYVSKYVLQGKVMFITLPFGKVRNWEREGVGKRAPAGQLLLGRLLRRLLMT